MEKAIDVFKGIHKTPMAYGGAYTLPGLHTVQIKECKIVQSVRHNTHMLIVEYLVLESTNPAMVKGSSRSWVVNFQHASAMSNAKNFLIAALNCSEDEVDEATANAVVHKSQPLRGVTVRCEAMQIKTKSGGDFTRCSWSFLSA